MLAENNVQLEKMKTEYGDLSVKYARLQAKLPKQDPEEAAAVERLKENPAKRHMGRKLSQEEFLDAMARKRGEL